MDQKILQEKALLYQMLQRQLEEINHQSMLLERKEVEFFISKEALVGIEREKENKEILIPLGSETFTYAKLADPNNVLVNMGAGVVVEKDIKSATIMLDEKIAEVEVLKDRVRQDATKVSQKMNEIVKEIEESQK